MRMKADDDDKEEEGVGKEEKQPKLLHSAHDTQIGNVKRSRRVIPLRACGFYNKLQNSHNLLLDYAGAVVAFFNYG